MVLIIVVARLGFGVPARWSPALGSPSRLLAAAALLAIGLLITALAPGRGPAAAIGTVLFFPLMFFAGLWLPIPSMPAVLQNISHATPLGAAWESFQDGVPRSLPVRAAAAASWRPTRWHAGWPRPGWFRWE